MRKTGQKNAIINSTQDLTIIVLVYHNNSSLGTLTFRLRLTLTRFLTRRLTLLQSSVAAEMSACVFPVFLLTQRMIPVSSSCPSNQKQHRKKSTNRPNFQVTQIWKKNQNQILALGHFFFNFLFLKVCMKLKFQFLFFLYHIHKQMMK